MAEVVENVEKVFKNYPYLPPELRLMVNDEMQPDDRCRFTRCSKRCQKEAKSSKKFIYGLEFVVPSFETRFVRVHFDEKETHGFSYKFEDEKERKSLIYLNSKDEELWRVELPFSKNSFQMALQRFEDLLEFYQNTIKKLFIKGYLIGGDWKNIDVKIKNFRNLETLKIYTDDHAIQSRIFSKLRRPLKKVEGHCFNENLEQLYQVTHQLVCSRLNLNYDQFLKICAPEIVMDIGYLTAKDIFNFITSWQNGEVRDNFMVCSWCHVSDAIRNELLSFFGLEVDELTGKFLLLRNHKDAKKRAGLNVCFSKSIIVFAAATKK